MRKTVLLLATAILFAACGGHSDEAPLLKNEQDTLSWAMGRSLAETVQGDFYNFNNDLVRQAFENTLNHKGQSLDDTTYQMACQYIAFLAQKYQRDAMAKNQSTAQEKEAEYFARLEKENPNVHKAPEGYYYEMVRAGKGPNAQKGKRIKFDFKGYLMLTGELFEETYGQRDPIIHVLGNPMFPGLQSAFTHMNAGSIYRFYFPQNLAFGASGSEGVPPYTPVIYEVELHEIYND